jgi:hypothetical protein
LSEAAPNSGIVKALRPLVGSLDSPGGGGAGMGIAHKASGLLGRFGQGLKKK